MDNNQSVAVLLATYNGEKYLAEQLESILYQRDIEPHIIIRDDGSSDQTLAIVDTYVSRYPNQITIIKKETASNGHLANFSALCEYALATPFQFFCFADQDDVWHETKVKCLLTRLAEAQSNIDTPVLVHSDLCVVDENLNLINSSFVQYQGLPDPATHDFPLFCHQNVVTGCATLFNRALLEIATPLPDKVIVHDYWFALNAKVFGKLIFEGKSLVNYRQHNVNSIGATALSTQRSFMSTYIYKMAYRYIKLFPSYIRQCIQITKHQNYTRNSNFYIDEFAILHEQSLIKRLNSIPLYFPNADTLAMKIYLAILMITLPLLMDEKC
ncbi:glycosyltransferase family 2 protein [Pseudoalteromonas spongiae]|uniref:glycosyltransferase family 2 protein n=1 Tax=Pseudoalteromonas spongiae TaxID=298657 RepID=UPI00110B433C|nr:glycosyltransferase family 2 protein [Pseudoalteromonas spongiae]TMO82046.1 hypothetical protein CWC15_20405 [Pseudoalteromonas spongiae]